MSSAEFHHFGVPTNANLDSGTYIDGAKVSITDPESHPYRVEFLKFDLDSPMHEALKTKPHAAFMVQSLDEALKGKNVIVEPFDATETLRVAFILDGDALIELMETI